MIARALYVVFCSTLAWSVGILTCISHQMKKRLQGQHIKTK